MIEEIKFIKETIEDIKKYADESKFKTEKNIYFKQWYHGEDTESRCLNLTKKELAKNIEKHVIKEIKDYISDLKLWKKDPPEKEFSHEWSIHHGHEDDEEKLDYEGKTLFFSESKNLNKDIKFFEQALHYHENKTYGHVSNVVNKIQEYENLISVMKEEIIEYQESIEFNKKSIKNAQQLISENRKILEQKIAQKSETTKGFQKLSENTELKEKVQESEPQKPKAQGRGR